MTTDTGWVAAAMTQSVPWVGTVGITFGETASGAIGLAAFGAVLQRATPLVVSSEIGYRKPARGPLTATAVLDRPAAEVLAELDAGKRPEFTVTVTITDAAAAETTRMTVVWTLRPNR